MSKTKGTDVITLRAALASKGPEVEKIFEQKLTPALVAVYRRITTTSWTEVADQMAIYQAAADVLFAQDPERMMRLGVLLGSKAFSGIYKLFLRVPTVEYIFKRAARIWNTYYEKGDAEIEILSTKCVDFVVHNFPDLPRPMREVAKGHYMAIMEMTGAKDIQIDMFDDNPQAWRWRIRWI